MNDERRLAACTHRIAALKDRIRGHLDGDTDPERLEVSARYLAQLIQEKRALRARMKADRIWELICDFNRKLHTYLRGEAPPTWRIPLPPDVTAWVWKVGDTAPPMTDFETIDLTRYPFVRPIGLGHPRRFWVYARTESEAHEIAMRKVRAAL